jgi:hypothetical protein
MIGVYLDEKIIKRFQDACAFFGLTMSQVLTAYITDKVEEYERNMRSESKGRTSSRFGEEDSRVESENEQNL